MNDGPVPRETLRVHYVLVWNAFDSAGVLRKVEEAVEVWTRLGVRVRASIVSRDPRAHDWAESLQRTSQAAQADAWPYTNWWTLNAAMRGCLDHNLVAADVVYTRFDLFTPALLTASRRVPVVLEVNSDLHRELERKRSVNASYRRATFGLTRSIASGIVFVSNELRGSAAFRRYRGDTIVIANGIDLSKSPETRAPVSADGPPRGVFIGSPDQAWHGVDKILDLSRRLPTWRFDIIGQNTPQEAVPHNVRFHGVLQREAYEATVRGADVAFGTLALHRKGMQEASPLKVREYLSLGIPTVSGYHDTDLGEACDALLVLPNVESNVQDNVERIERFVARWRGRRVSRSSIAAIDLRSKEVQRLDFFRNVIGRRASERRS